MLTHLYDLDELEAAIEESRERPVFLFKHSRTCGPGAYVGSRPQSELRRPPFRRLERGAASALHGRINRTHDGAHDSLHVSGQSQAAPLTPLESPRAFSTSLVFALSENTNAVHSAGTRS